LIFIIKDESLIKGDEGIFLGGEKLVKNREKLLEEIFELALQNDMNYFG
jgi:hypothetical protein